VAQLRARLNECITLDMVKQVIDAIFHLVLAGNIPAARLFLQYAVGKPEPIPGPDSLDAADPVVLDGPPEVEDDAAPDIAPPYEARNESPSRTDQTAPSPGQTACAPSPSPGQTASAPRLTPKPNESEANGSPPTLPVPPIRPAIGASITHDTLRLT
jgi:hypothetical protein